MTKIGLKTLLASALISLSANAYAEVATTPATEVIAVQAADLNAFRYDLAEMEDIASSTKLKHRIFYAEPSTGPDAAWFDAVKQGNIELVQAMVANGQNIEAKDIGSLDQTALGWAAFIGYEDISDFLVEQGADLWATDKGDVYHVLKSAVLGKNVNIVKKMREALKDTYNINDTTYEDDGESLVMVAASNNRLAIVEYFIGEGADLNLVTTIEDPARYSFNHSALSYACQIGYKEMQQLLIDNGAINHRTSDISCQ